MRHKEKLHEWIDRYNNNELSGEELEIFLEIMKKDYRVREEVWLDNELNSILKQDDILELRKKIKKICSEKPDTRNRNTRIILMAASILVLLSVEYTIFYLTHAPKKTNKSDFSHFQISPEKTEFSQKKKALSHSNHNYAIFQKDKQHSLGNDTLEIENTYDLLACYQPNIAQENLIGATNRSGSIRMLKPAMFSVFSRKSTIWFSWKTENPEETSLIVENNHGNVVYESDTNYNQSVFLKASYLDFGLFYYKIMRKDEVIYFGKFTVH